MKVYVDGENYRHGVADVLVSEGRIKRSRDLESFPLKKLLSDVLAVDDLEIAYYAAKIKLPRGYEPAQHILDRAAEIREYNRKWVASLVDQGVEHIKAGYLKVKSGDPCPKCGERTEVLQEKGVDVRLAVDLIADLSPRSKSKKIVLMSSDTDLIPAVDRVRKHGSYIIYVCFGESVNRALSAASDETVTISKAKVAQLYQESISDD